MRAPGCSRFYRPTIALPFATFAYLAWLPVHCDAQTQIAVIDTARVLRHSQRFAEGMDQLEELMRDYQAGEAADLRRLAERTRRISLLKPGSGARDREEQELEKVRSDLEVKRQLTMRAIQRQEARAYFEFYEDLQQELSRHCRRNGVALVLRSDDQLPDASALLSRQVVFHDGADVTDVIIERLNAGGGRPYGTPTVRARLGKRARAMSALPIIAIQQAATARAAWALDRAVFPPAS